MTSAMVNPLRFAEDDSSKHRLLIHQLRKTGGWHDNGLSAAMESCSPDNPCRSGACILCGRRLQYAVYNLIKNAIRLPSQRTRRGRMSMATIIPASGIAAPEALTAEVCKAAIADIATAVRRARLSPSVCGFDVSFNEDQAGQVAPHWTGHGHLAFGDWPSTRQEAALREAVTTSEVVRRHVQVERLDGRANGPLYAVKPDRGRRVSYINDKHSHRAPFRDSHRRDLRPWQAVALAQVEHELGLHNRLIITGIDQNTIKTALKGLYWPQDGP